MLHGRVSKERADLKWRGGLKKGRGPGVARLRGDPEQHAESCEEESERGNRRPKPIGTVGMEQPGDHGIGGGARGADRKIEPEVHAASGAGVRAAVHRAFRGASEGALQETKTRADLQFTIKRPRNRFPVRGLWINRSGTIRPIASCPCSGRFFSDVCSFACGNTAVRSPSDYAPGRSSTVTISSGVSTAKGSSAGAASAYADAAEIITTSRSPTRLVRMAAFWCEARRSLRVANRSGRRSAESSRCPFVEGAAAFEEAFSRRWRAGLAKARRGAYRVEDVMGRRMKIIGGRARPGVYCAAETGLVPFLTPPHVRKRDFVTGYPPFF